MAGNITRHNCLGFLRFAEISRVVPATLDFTHGQTTSIPTCHPHGDPLTHPRLQYPPTQPPYPRLREWPNALGAL